MQRHLFSAMTLVALFGWTLALAGCASEPEPAGAPETVTNVAPDADIVVDEHAEPGHDHTGHDEYAAALAKLSPADRALAEKQKICPVSGEPLGSMGTPTKVNVKGRNVLLCCDGCEATIKENPDEYLAKLDQQ